MKLGSITGCFSFDFCFLTFLALPFKSVVEAAGVSVLLAGALERVILRVAVGSFAGNVALGALAGAAEGSASLGAVRAAPAALMAGITGNSPAGGAGGRDVQRRYHRQL